MAAMVHVASDPCQSNPVQPKSPSAASSRSVAWRAPVLALARGEVESRLARVRGLVPAGEAEGPEQAADYLVDGRRLAVDVRVSDENGQHVYKSSLLDDELSRERPGVASKPEAHARRRRFGFSGGSGNLVELKVEATGCELSSRWPRYRLSQLHVHILYRESPSDDYWDPGADTNDDDDVFELSKIQHDILEMFIKSVRIVKAATALSSFSLGSVPSRPRRCLHPYKKEPGPGVELVDAAAEVLVGLCTTAVCALNGSCSAERPRRATAQPRPRRTLEWAVEDLKAGARPSTGAGEAAKVVPKRSLTWGGAGAPGAQRTCSPRGKSRRKVADGPGRGLASGGLDVADAEAPTELDPTPWDGPTTSDDSLHLWRAVANQDPEVEAELRKIEEQSRERGGRNWLSRVLEHRRKFRHTSNPKPLTGTVLLFALQELEQAVSADVSGDIAADICTRLVERGADAEATYKVERCGKEQAELVAPLCFAARSTRALELLREFKVAFGKASRINYFRHGSLLWQAVWINDEDMVRFLLQADRADQRLRGGKHLYEVAYVDSREVALPRVLQCSSIKDAKHNRTDRAGGDASCFQISNIARASRRGRRCGE
ncbi:unnamed protein product [Prorocentrum cordatum]|uniref:Uncharacterized protein n=1 Tax=Prorocentrum cordatum TaxID=2364126 RepID=A0ABN9T428_9DINO|nr:unnamed protein product [Polarella glacialis]